MVLKNSLEKVEWTGNCEEWRSKSDSSFFLPICMKRECARNFKFDSSCKDSNALFTALKALCDHVFFNCFFICGFSAKTTSAFLVYNKLTGVNTF